MKTPPAGVRILVATDNVDDAQQILRQLAEHFDNVRASTRSDLAVKDFEEHKPQVLVLAFDTLDKAERYYLGLYRLGSTLPRETHRTVVLCNKEDAGAVFELCKKSYFDDYVLHWPQAHDGLRLVMSIWIACREMASIRIEPPQPAELPAHVDTTQPLAAQVAKVRPIVMVVEDDEFARQLVSRALNPQAWELAFVGDAPSALRLLRRMRPDVILMDIRLPGVDGVSLTQKLKASKESAAIPIIMMTGDSRRETLIGAMEAGATAFVVKPFTRESLTEKLDKVFRR